MEWPLLLACLLLLLLLLLTHLLLVVMYDGGEDQVHEEEEAEDKCQVCDTASDAQNLMLCDMCDEAYHTYCLRPVLKRVPPGEWACPRCDASGGTECPDKFVSPISRGLDKVSSFLAALAQAALGA